MDVFSRNKLLLRLVILLIIINLSFMGFIFWQEFECGRKLHRPENNKSIDILSNKLKLSKQQENQLKELRTEFFKKEEVLSSQIKMERDSMNEVMFSDKPDTLLLNSLARRVAENEYLMEKYRIEQALMLQQICNKSQLEKFRSLVIEIRDYFKPEKRKEKPPK